MFRKKKVVWLLLLPGLAGLMLFYVVPFFGGIYSSLMDGSFENQFVGLANYERTLQNSMFQLGLRNTWELSLLCAPVIWLLAFLLARKTDLRFRGAPWYVYLVGVLGIAIVASSSWCTLRVGASVMLAISTAGQIISSQLIDQFGFFGMPVQKFNVKQIPGYVLLAAGVALVVTG